VHGSPEPGGSGVDAKTIDALPKFDVIRRGAIRDQGRNAIGLVEVVRRAGRDHRGDRGGRGGERLRVVQRVGEALAYAHSCGVLHRDLKPQNVMVGAFGEVYVMDWGVQAVAGTPAFRAPEGSRDGRSDIYSLGALLQFTLGSSSLPAPLTAIAQKAMSADPAARYASAAEVLAQIARFQDGLAVDAHHETPWQALRRFGARNAVLLWLLAAYVGVRFLLFFLRRL